MGSKLDDIVSVVLSEMMKDINFEEPVLNGYYVYTPDKSFYNISGDIFIQKVKTDREKLPIYSLNNSKLENVSK